MAEGFEICRAFGGALASFQPIPNSTCEQSSSREMVRQEFWLTRNSLGKAPLQDFGDARVQLLHARIAEVLERRFPERVAREPELLAHHLTGARLFARAIGYWLKAGERAAERSANLEALRHLTRGLEALRTLPESTERDRRELAFQIALGTPLIAVHGYSAPQTGA